MADETTVATFNCGGNGADPLKWRLDREFFPATALLQDAIQELIVDYEGTMSDLIVNPFPYKHGEDATVDDLYNDWMQMTPHEFYTSENIYRWRLTMRVDLMVESIYPWTTTKRPSVDAIEDTLRAVIKPMPERYGLPADIQASSVELQRIATHMLAQMYWELVPPDLLAHAHAEVKFLSDRKVVRAVDQILGCADRVDIVLVQEMLPLMIKTIDAIDAYEVIYNPNPEATFFTGIVYKAGRHIRMGSWTGDERHVVAMMQIHGTRHVIASVHGIASSGDGVIGVAKTAYERAQGLGIERVIVGGDANTCTGDNVCDAKGVVTQLGSRGLRHLIHHAYMLTTAVPMWHEPTQCAVKSYLQANGFKAGERSEKSCDFIATSQSDTGYMLEADTKATLLPTRRHVSDHMILQARIEWPFEEV